MLRVEERLKEWLMKHALVLGYAAVALLGLFLRWSYMPMLSADLKFMNASWFDAIKTGGMGAVLEPSLQYTYSPLHLYIWALAAKLLGAMDTRVALKLVSLLMELGALVACVVLLKVVLPTAQDKLKRFLGFTLLLLSPVMLWNVAGWGQTDAAYAAFSVLAVWLLLRERPVWGLCALGVALAFKLQAVFLLPLFVFAYFCGRKRFSVLWFLLVPGILVVSGIPMVFVGESPLYAVNIYLGQTGMYNQITYNAPNLFAIMGDAISSNGLNNDLFSRTGIVLCIAALGGMAVWLMVRRTRLNERLTVLLGAWCVLCCLFFLPRMHERYGMVGELLLLVWVVTELKPRGFVYVLLNMLATLSAYAQYLLRNPFFPLQVGGVLNLIVLCALTWEVVRAVRVTGETGNAALA